MLIAKEVKVKLSVGITTVFIKLSNFNLLGHDYIDLEFMLKYSSANLYIKVSSSQLDFESTLKCSLT